MQIDALVAEVELAVAPTLPSSRPSVPPSRVIWREQDAPFPPEPFVALSEIGGEPETFQHEVIGGEATQRVVSLGADPPDGLYTLTIQGRDYTATADGSTAAEVLTTLADAALGGGERLIASLDAGVLRLTGIEPGDVFSIAVGSPGGALLLEVLDPPDYGVRVEVVRKIYLVTVEIQVGTRIDDTAPAHLQGPTDLMRRIDSALGASEVGDRLERRGVVIHRTGRIRSPAARLRGSQWGRRAVLDVVVRIASLESTATGWIETFEGTGTLAPDGTGTSITIPFESEP